MNKLLTLGVVTLAVAGIVGIGSLSTSALNSQNSRGAQIGAHRGNGQGGGRQSSLESHAKVLGMNADDLEKALEDKTMSQIAKEMGMTESDFQTKMAEIAKARWEARGLSDDEITKRIAEREECQATNSIDHEWGSGAGTRQGRYNKNR